MSSVQQSVDVRTLQHGLGKKRKFEVLEMWNLSRRIKWNHKMKNEVTVRIGGEEPTTFMRGKSHRQNTAILGCILRLIGLVYTIFKGVVEKKTTTEILEANGSGCEVWKMLGYEEVGRERTKLVCPLNQTGG